MKWLDDWRARRAAAHDERFQAAYRAVVAEREQEDRQGKVEVVFANINSPPTAPARPLAMEWVQIIPREGETVNLRCGVLRVVDVTHSIYNGQTILIRGELIARGES